MTTTVSLLPADIDIYIEQGADSNLEFVLTDSAGTAVDITSDSVKFTAKDSWAGDTKIATKTNASGQHSDPSHGKTRFLLTKADTTTDDRTSNVTWRYEIRRVLATTNQEVVYMKGKLILARTVGLASASASPSPSA
jgi:hypothetical protein